MSDLYVLPKGVAIVTAAGLVKTFQEKPRWQGPGKIAVGLVYLNANGLVKTCGGLPSTVGQLRRSRYKDFMADIVRDLASKDAVAAYTTKATWKDIGSFQDYLDVQRELDKKESAKASGTSMRISPTEPGLSVFLSYQISNEDNLSMVEGVLAPCLSSAGYRVVSGAKLNRARGATGSPAARARQMIDTCDILVAIGTPEGKDKKPSGYVIDEVTYAQSTGKQVLLFIERDTTVPGHWENQFAYTRFEKSNVGALVRDILELVANAE